MSIINKMKSGLDPKECFLAWVETGTVEKALEFINNKGVINPRSGKHYSVYSIWRASMMWVIENPNEAREYYIKEGAVFSDLEWDEFIVKKACHLYGYSKNRLISWIRRHGFENYDYIYEPKTGVSKVS